MEVEKAGEDASMDMWHRTYLPRYMTRSLEWNVVPDLMEKLEGEKPHIMIVVGMSKLGNES